MLYYRPTTNSTSGTVRVTSSPRWPMQKRPRHSVKQGSGVRSEKRKSLVLQVNDSTKLQDWVVERQKAVRPSMQHPHYETPCMAVLGAKTMVPSWVKRTRAFLIRVRDLLQAFTDLSCSSSEWLSWRDTTALVYTVANLKSEPWVRLHCWSQSRTTTGTRRIPESFVETTWTPRRTEPTSTTRGSYAQNATINDGGDGRHIRSERSWWCWWIPRRPSRIISSRHLEGDRTSILLDQHGDGRPEGTTYPGRAASDEAVEDTACHFRPHSRTLPCIYHHPSDRNVWRESTASGHLSESLCGVLDWWIACSRDQGRYKWLFG